MGEYKMKFVNMEDVPDNALFVVQTGEKKTLADIKRTIEGWLAANATVIMQLGDFVESTENGKIYHLGGYELLSMAMERYSEQAREAGKGEIDFGETVEEKIAKCTELLNNPLHLEGEFIPTPAPSERMAADLAGINLGLEELAEKIEEVGNVLNKLPKGDETDV